MNNMWIIGIKSGIITFLGMVIYGLLLPLLRPFYESEGLQYIVWGLGIYSAHYYYKAANGGLMSYGQGVSLGLMVSSFTGLLNSLLVYGYLKYTDPNANKELSEQLQHLLGSRGVEEAALVQVRQFMESVTPEFLFLGTFVSTILLGFFLTLFIAAFSRSSKKST